ncbi:hypothetical protein QBC44DRAFT_391805 [Cladorrhinum sp. PSN332]|nr:hypothetical protein QBC44DRAFT_391805 [Cladorrhinum sp. PSN332]
MSAILSQIEGFLNGPQDQLHAVIRALCINDRDVRRQIAALFGKVQEAQSSEASRKRKRDLSEFRICERCHDTFFEAENEERVCEFHPGNLDVNWRADTWADHDERFDGPEDTSDNREEYPEGFIWDCCDAQGDADGCKKATHRAKDCKRRRTDSSDEGEDDGKDDEDGNQEDDEDEEKN